MNFLILSDASNTTEKPVGIILANNGDLAFVTKHDFVDRMLRAFMSQDKIFVESWSKDRVVRRRAVSKSSDDYLAALKTKISMPIFVSHQGKSPKSDFSTVSKKLWNTFFVTDEAEEMPAVTEIS